MTAGRGDLRRLIDLEGFSILSSPLFYLLMENKVEELHSIKDSMGILNFYAVNCSSSGTNWIKGPYVMQRMYMEVKVLSYSDHHIDLKLLMRMVNHGDIQEHLVRYGSDHSPIMLFFFNLGLDNRRRSSPFRFDPMWLRESACKDVVSKA